MPILLPLPLYFPNSPLGSNLHDSNLVKSLDFLRICYGHQIIARALGGEVKLNPKGWELGCYEAELNEEGREWLGFENDTNLVSVG